MRVLFINNAFPDVFGPLAALFAEDAESEVLFLSGYGRREYSIPGVRRVVLKVNRRHGAYAEERPGPDIDRDYAMAKQACGAFADLRSMGFVPDIVLATARRGYALFVPEAFPESFLVGYAGADYAAPDALTPGGFSADLVQSRLMLHSHVWCAGPFGKASLPSNRSASEVRMLASPFCADTAFFSPGPVSRKGEDISFRITDADAFAKSRLDIALPVLLRRRPHCRLILTCGDAATQDSLREWASGLSSGLPARVAVVRRSDRKLCRDILRAVRAHAFVGAGAGLAQEVLESMSCAALTLVPKDLVPTGEEDNAVIRPGVDGLVHAVSSAEEWLNIFLGILDDPRTSDAMGGAARSVILKRYDCRKVLLRHKELLLDAYSRWKTAAPAGSRLQSACSGDRDIFRER